MEKNGAGENYLTNGIQAVEVKKLKSDVIVGKILKPAIIKSGAPPGSVLGPLCT